MADDRTTPRPDLTREREIADAAAEIVELAREYADCGDWDAEFDTLLERYDALTGVARAIRNPHGFCT